MFNTKLPTQSELPTSRQLLRSTVIAVGVAAALLLLHAQHAVGAPQAERTPVERCVEEGHASVPCSEQRAQVAPRDLGVGRPAVRAEPFALRLPRCCDPGRDDGRGLARAVLGDLRPRDRTDLDLEVDAVEERPGEPAEVPSARHGRS